MPRGHLHWRSTGTSDSTYVKLTLFYPKVCSACWIPSMGEFMHPIFQVRSLDIITDSALSILTFNKVLSVLPLNIFWTLSSCSLISTAFCPCHHGIWSLSLQQTPNCPCLFFSGLGLLWSIFHAVFSIVRVFLWNSNLIMSTLSLSLPWLMPANTSHP